MGDDLRGRHSSQKRVDHSSKSDSIFGIWNDQRRMQAEEDKIALELAETKKKARELSRTLRKHRYGEVKQESLSKLNSALSLLRLKSHKVIKATRSWMSSHKMLATGLASVAVVLFVGSISYSLVKPDPKATLGDSTSSLLIADELPREKPKFPILYPSTKSPDDFDVVRISPDGADVSYTYLDQLTSGGVVFKITQQEVPEGFDLEKTATDFQATNIIQIDEGKVYHGYSEKGGVQSLIFTKNDKLITIRSPQKLTDDQWAGYIISLQ